MMSKKCLHCCLKTPSVEDFCCNGCLAAYSLIRELGLEKFYKTRTLNSDEKPLTPDETRKHIDMSHLVQNDENGMHTLHLTVEGIHCASCVVMIEDFLMKQKDVLHARINMSTSRLVLKWEGEASYGSDLADMVSGLGYRLVPFDPTILISQNKKFEKYLLHNMAIAGFAAGNIMMLSVALWSSDSKTMGFATRDFFNIISAMIALPAIVYAGRPFFRSAIVAIKSGHSNMDVPISLAVIFAPIISISEIINHGEHVYFDSAVMLLFFLLTGRYLDAKAKGKACAAAEQLLLLNTGSATIMEGDKYRVVPISEIKTGDMILVAAGEKIAADGVVTDGESEVDSSLITGEIIPQEVTTGTKVFAGTINLSIPLTIKVLGVGENTLLGEITTLMEKSEQAQARYVRLADKIAGFYTPVVHILAIGTFIGWIFIGGAEWQVAALNAVTVLIITCPCALGLAVPVVQVIASSRLMKNGILLKSGNALEKLSSVDTVVFDKTGTLTIGMPELCDAQQYNNSDLQLASSLAIKSQHPLSKAICRAYDGELLRLDVEEFSGSGLKAIYDGNEIMLGNGVWCGAAMSSDENAEMPEIWLKKGDDKPIKFSFTDTLRDDAKETIQRIKNFNMKVILLSGDRSAVVEKVAKEAEIQDFFSEVSPVDKSNYLEKLKNDGCKVLMVGDGLNDAPALAAATVSASPSSAVDISQNAADIVFQGEYLSPVMDIISVSKEANTMVKQNFILAFLYNIIAVPLAVFGMATPLIAAVAMSSSSLIVILNAMRLTIKKRASE